MLSFRDRSTESAFFTVLNSDDLWKELRKWMYPGKKTSNFYNYKNGDIAVYYNYTAIIKSSTSIIFTKESVTTTIANGNLDILKILIGKHNIKPHAWMIDLAALNGHLDIIKYIDIMTVEELSFNAIGNAAENGHLETLRWLYYNRKEGNINNILYKPIRYGHLDIVKFLYSVGITKCKPIPTNVAIVSGHIHIVRYLCEEFKEPVSNDMISLAIKYGRSEILNYLLGINKLSIKSKFYIPLAATSRNSVIEILRYFNIDWYS